VLTGEPQKYRRTEDGRFLLYSVARNGKDDGGSLAKGDSGPKDWVWILPED
jgi:hypothetical protein